MAALTVVDPVVDLTRPRKSTFVFSDATEFLLVRELLSKAGMPESAAELWLPYIPRAVRDAWSVAEDPVKVRRSFAKDLMQAYRAGMPADLCLQALESGIMPTDALLLWQSGRSDDTYKLVLKASTQTRLERNRDGISDEVVRVLLDTSHAEVREWMTSPIPRDRILIYIRAGIPPSEALELHEPKHAAGEGIEAARMLAGLASPFDYDKNATPDPMHRH